MLTLPDRQSFADMSAVVPSRAAGIAFLTRNGEDSHLACFSSFGARTDECAPVAWRLAYVVAQCTGEPMCYRDLDHAMGLVVNDHEDVRSIIREYGHRQYR
jgi:hypothetical protein